MTDDTTSVPAGSGAPRPTKPGKRAPWLCPHCGDVVIIANNCRKADCLAKTEAARARMGLGGAR